MGSLRGSFPHTWLVQVIEQHIKLGLELTRRSVAFRCCSILVFSGSRRSRQRYQPRVVDLAFGDVQQIVQCWDGYQCRSMASSLPGATQPVDRQHRGHAGHDIQRSPRSRCRAKTPPTPTAFHKLQSKDSNRQTVAFVLHEPSSLAPGDTRVRREAPHRSQTNFNCVLSPCSLKASMVFCQRA